MRTAISPKCHVATAAGPLNVLEGEEAATEVNKVSLPVEEEREEEVFDIVLENAKGDLSAVDRVADRGGEISRRSSAIVSFYCYDV